MPTILLVEDNPHIMKINAQLLSMQGYAVLKAATAEEARNRLKEKQADLIVLDVMLPDGGGLELCRELKTRYPANVKHFFTLLGKMFFTPYGKEFFTYLGKQIFTS